VTKILLVDDEKHIGLLYSEELQEAGYKIITAQSGYKLLE
jgi:DNA-binding response OmpR family regulator